MDLPDRFQNGLAALRSAEITTKNISNILLLQDIISV